MNFQNKAPKIAAAILCIGMPVRDLTFHTTGGSRTRFQGERDALRRNLRRQRAQWRDRHRSARRPRLDLRADGRRQGNIEPLHLRQMAHEGIETKHLIHMPGW
jgi:hypothetical protein